MSTMDPSRWDGLHYRLYLCMGAAVGSQAAVSRLVHQGFTLGGGVLQ